MRKQARLEGNILSVQMMRKDNLEKVSAVNTLLKNKNKNS